SPNNPFAMNNLGYLYAEYGLHRQEAQKLCQDAVNAMPENPGFHDSLGWASFKNEQFEKAEKELLKSISMKDGVYDPYYHLGTLYYSTKKHEKAISFLEKAVSIKPDAPEALNNFAYLLAEMNRDSEKALEMANRALRIEPNNPSYLDTLGWAEYRAGNLNGAMIALKRALQLAPDVAEILAHLGRVNLDLGQFEISLDFLKQAWKADPSIESLQKEIFLVLTLKSLFENLSEYHRIFGGKADSKHISSILFQVNRVYQEEGLFEKAISITKICEKLQKGQVDLTKPLMDFYSLPIASGEIKGAFTAQPKGIPETSNEGKKEALSFPLVSEVPLALNFGPSLFSIFSPVINSFEQFSSVSLSLFIGNVLFPFSCFQIEIEIP
ncbi:tetratricopeptide repeat protein, partial [bacterium]|nr:tetratricopeptide repeat protein [bacterium]